MIDLGELSSDPAFLASLLLGQARISETNNERPAELDDQYLIDYARLDVDGIEISNHGMVHRLVVVPVNNNTEQ